MVYNSEKRTIAGVNSWPARDYAPDDFVVTNLLRSQAEYYFSDYNLRQNGKLLASLIETSEEEGKCMGFLRISEVVQMPRIRSISDDPDLIMKALMTSTLLTVVNGRFVGRPGFIPPKCKTYPPRKTIFLYGLPATTTTKSVGKLMASLGEVSKIQLDCGPGSIDAIVGAQFMKAQSVECGERYSCAYMRTALVVFKTQKMAFDALAAYTGSFVVKYRVYNQEKILVKPRFQKAAYIGNNTIPTSGTARPTKPRRHATYPSTTRGIRNINTLTISSEAGQRISAPRFQRRTAFVTKSSLPSLVVFSGEPWRPIKRTTPKPIKEKRDSKTWATGLFRNDATNNRIKLTRSRTMDSIREDVIYF